MIKKFFSQDGFLDDLLWTAFIIGILFIGIVFGWHVRVQNVCTSAAREGSRAMAVYHSTTTAKQKASDTITAQLYVGSGPTGTAIHSTFDANSPNPSSPDVVITDNGTYSTVVVTYHMPNVVPMLPKIFNSSASAWSKYIDVTGEASFKDEVL